eukprot:gene12195-14126_t
MGAAASLKLVYFDAMTWFKAYLLGGSYVEDFRELDVNGDGGITFDELQSWIDIKARDDPSWRVIVKNQAIFTIAHNLASKTVPGVDHLPNRVVGLESFKQFLLHLFVLSILWVHFKHADDWSEGRDVGNERLTLEEFKMAFRTFNSAQANETFSEEKIVADFNMLDTDKSGSVEFTEVCAYCAQFVDADFAENFLTSRTPAAAHASFIMTGDDEAAVKKKHEHEHTSEDAFVRSNDLAIQMVAREMEKNEHIAKFEEIKINTEVMLGVF